MDGGDKNRSVPPIGLIGLDIPARSTSEKGDMAPDRGEVGERIS